MDVRFPGVAFGGARADARAAARGARRRSEGEASKAAIELGVDEARRCPHAERRGGFARSALVQGLRQDLQRAERRCRACTTRNAGCRSGRRWRGGDGEGRRRAATEHGVPLASPVSGGGAERFGGAQGDRGSGRDLGEPEGRARAGTQGTAAGRQGEEARPLARAGPVLMAAGPERDDGQRGAAQGRCGGARGCPRSFFALLVSDGGASYPPCAAALGVSHEALNRSGAICIADGEQPPQ